MMATFSSDCHHPPPLVSCQIMELIKGNRRSSKGELMLKKLKSGLQPVIESPVTTISTGKELLIDITIQHFDTNADGSKSNCAQSEIDENVSTAIKTFKNLDVVLMSFRRKNTKGSIKNISDSFLKLFGIDFNISIIPILLFLCPCVYNVEWEMSVSGLYELVISFPTENIILNDRLQQIRNAIIDSSVSLSWSLLNSRAQTNCPIPPKPQSLPDHFLANSSLLKKTKRPQTVRNELILKRPRVVVEGNHNAEDNSATTLEELKQLATERRLLSEQNAIKRAQENERKAQQATINILPALCSTLRSYCMIDKKFSMTTNACVSKLASDFRSSKADIRRSLRVLMDEFPEFLTETQPDILVPFATIKVNSNIDFSSFHKRLVSFVVDSTSDSSKISTIEQE